MFLHYKFPGSKIIIELYFRNIQKTPWSIQLCGFMPQWRFLVWGNQYISSSDTHVLGTERKYNLLPIILFSSFDFKNWLKININLISSHRLYTRCWINTGTNKRPIDIIFEWLLVEIWACRLFHMCSSCRYCRNSHIFHRKLIHRKSIWQKL